MLLATIGVKQHEFATMNSLQVFPSPDFSPRHVKCVLEMFVYVARV